MSMSPYLSPPKNKVSSQQVCVSVVQATQHLSHTPTAELVHNRVVSSGFALIFFNRVDLRKLPPPTLNTKDTRASNWHWRRFRHSALTTFSIATMSCRKNASACSFVTAIPGSTPDVCPYPTVQTPAGHLQAFSCSPSNCRINEYAFSLDFIMLSIISLFDFLIIREKQSPVTDFADSETLPNAERFQVTGDDELNDG